MRTLSLKKRERERRSGNIHVFGSNGIVGFHNEMLVKGPGIIIGRKGSVGEINFSKKDFWPIDTTYYVRTKQRNDIAFWYYFLNTLGLNQMNSHSAVPGLNRDNVYGITVLLPSLPEQRDIAKILSDLDDKIELNQQMNKTLEKIGQALFKHWFVNFEFPFDSAQGKPNEKGKPYKSSGGEMVDSELGEIPQGWRAGTLKEIIEITSGKRPSDKSDIKKDEFNIPLIGASSIMGYVRESLYNEPILIIGRVGTHGVVQRVSYSSFPSDNTLVIKSRYYNFVFHILKRLDYNSLNVGTTQPLITQSGIKQIGIIIPQNDILSKFEKTLMVLHESIDRNLSENETLFQIRDFLLPRLISGKIRVRRRGV